MNELLIIALAYIHAVHMAIGAVTPSAFCWQTMDFYRVLAAFVVLAGLQRVPGYLRIAINSARKRKPEPEPLACPLPRRVEFLPNQAGQYMLAIRKGAING